MSEAPKPPDKEAEAIRRFHIALGMAAQFNYNLGKSAPVDPTNITNADLDRLHQAQFNGDGTTTELWKNWQEWNNKLSQAAPDVLKVFRRCKADASAVYYFLMDSPLIRRRTGPWDHVPALATVYNLSLQKSPAGEEPPIPANDLSGEHPTTQLAAAYITANPGAQGDDIDNYIHRSPGHFRNHIIRKLRPYGFTGSKKAGYQPPK